MMVIILARLAGMEVVRLRNMNLDHKSLSPKTFSIFKSESTVLTAELPSLVSSVMSHWNFMINNT